MFDKENNHDMLYIYNIYWLSDMHDNDDMNNLDESKIFQLVEHHLLWKYIIEKRKKTKQIVLPKFLFEVFRCTKCFST